MTLLQVCHIVMLLPPLGLIYLAVVATLILVRCRQLSKLYKVSLFALSWLIPFIGSICSLYIVESKSSNANILKTQSITPRPNLVLEVILVVFGITLCTVGFLNIVIVPYLVVILEELGPELSPVLILWTALGPIVFACGTTCLVAGSPAQAIAGAVVHFLESQKTGLLSSSIGLSLACSVTRLYNVARIIVYWLAKAVTFVSWLYGIIFVVAGAMAGENMEMFIMFLSGIFALTGALYLQVALPKLTYTPGVGHLTKMHLDRHYEGNQRRKYIACALGGVVFFLVLGVSISLVKGLGLISKGWTWDIARNAPSTWFNLQMGRIPIPPLVEVPAGHFIMGASPKDPHARAQELPRHEVLFSEPFLIGQYEITFEQYDAYIFDVGGTFPHDSGLTWFGSGWGRGDRPVINVTWHEARAYAAWLSQKIDRSCRLPTEAEWEYAARGGTKTDYWWGNSARWSNHNHANCFDCSDHYNETTPVGSFKPNPFGLYDTAGNAQEWVEDCWHESYEGAPTDGAAWTSGPECGRKVIRGGSTFVVMKRVRSAAREWQFSGSGKAGRHQVCGFRIVCSPSVP